MKYAIITGAYGGMGSAAVKHFINNGYTVFALDRVVMQSQSESVIPICVDLTSEENIKLALEKIVAVTDSVDAIVHFAGVYTLDSLLEMSEQKFVTTFNINLFGVYRVNKLFLPLLKKGSRIVITTSELAPIYPLPFTGIYAITKTALERYAYSLRMEAQLLGIKVSVIRPGAVKTGLLKSSTDQLDAFVENTTLYKCNAKRFKKIVDSVEAKSVSPEKVAKKAFKAVTAKRPKYTYNLNRNPLLLLLNALPKRMQTAIIKMILKDK